MVKGKEKVKEIKNKKLNLDIYDLDQILKEYIYIGFGRNKIWNLKKIIIKLEK